MSSTTVMTENANIGSMDNLPHGKIGFKERTGYAAGNIGISLLWATVGAFITYYYTDIIGISAMVVGNILFIVRLCDAFSDLGMGMIIDRTKSKQGKARPWLIRMCVPYALLCFAVFAFPDLGTNGTIIYAFVTFLLFNLAYSGVIIPYNTLTTIITQDPYQRSVLTIFSAVLGLTVTMLASIFLMPIVNSLGGTETAWLKVIGIFCVISIIPMFIAYKSTKERVRPSVVTKQIPLKRGIKALLRNKYWFIMLLINVTMNLFLGLMLGLSAYYAQNVLNNMNMIALLSMAATLPTILGMFIIAPFIKKLGNRNTALAGTVIQIIGGVIMLFDPTNVTSLVVGMCIRSLGYTALVATSFSMLGDTVEYGEWKTGMRTEGLIFSAASVGNKFGSSIGAALIGWILGAAGYIAGGGATQSSEVVSSIKFMYIHLPIGVSVVSLILLLFFNLEKKRPKIIAELEALRIENNNL